jgi:hypothetical protein
LHAPDIASSSPGEPFALETGISQPPLLGLNRHAAEVLAEQFARGGSEDPGKNTAKRPESMAAGGGSGRKHRKTTGVYGCGRRIRAKNRENGRSLTPRAQDPGKKPGKRPESHAESTGSGQKPGKTAGVYGCGRRIRAKTRENDRSLTLRAEDPGKNTEKRPESMAAGVVKQHSGTKMLPYGTRGKGQVAFQPQNAAIRLRREGLSSISAS